MQPRPDDELYWTQQRERMGLDPGTLMFNTGTCGPVPTAVVEAVQHLRGRLYRSPSDFVWRQLPVRLDYARRRLANYLNVAHPDLLLFANATIGLNVAAKSLDFPAGSEILATDHEYGAMRFMLEHVAGKRGWTIREVALPFQSEDPAEIAAAVLDAIGPKTKLLFFSHVMCTTGLVTPAEAICKGARERSVVTMIDGAHAPGMVPIDLERIGADYYAGNCHKWLLAPLGAAFLHVKSGRERLEPLVTSWGWGYDPSCLDEDSGWGGSFWARNLEFHGTSDRTPQCVLPEVLDFRASLGGDAAVTARMQWLSKQLRERFAAIGMKCVTPASESLHGSLTAFEIPKIAPTRLRHHVWEKFRIEAPESQVGGRFFWRISTAWFNTIAELDRLTEAAQQIKWSQLA